MNLKNKIAVINGGNRGIGLATAKELIAQKATVINFRKKKRCLRKSGESNGGHSLYRRPIGCNRNENIGYKPTFLSLSGGPFEL